MTKLTIYRAETGYEWHYSADEQGAKLVAQYHANAHGQPMDVDRLEVDVGNLSPGDLAEMLNGNLSVVKYEPTLVAVMHPEKKQDESPTE